METTMLMLMMMLMMRGMMMMVMMIMMMVMLMMIMMVITTLVEATPISGPALMWIPQWLSLLIVEPTVFVTPEILIIIIITIIILDRLLYLTVYI